MSVQSVNEDLPTQTQPDSRNAAQGNDQVKNHAGGYVYELEDLKQLQRFAILGCEGGTYYVMEEKVERENIQSLDRLIAGGKGIDAVKLLKEISVNRRNVKQNSLIYAFSILCRCNDIPTKKAAYEVINDICRIPTHLFMFVNYSEQIATGTGWGRAHKRAVASWYLKFDKTPVSLAYAVTKYRSREKWGHRDVVRLAHVHTSSYSTPLAFILRYIAKGYEEAKSYYMKEIMQPDDKMYRIDNLMKMYEDAAMCKDADKLCEMIREHKLSREHCPMEMLRDKSVWQALLPHMPVEALIRNLGKMSNIGMFGTNSNDEVEVLRKIRQINKPQGSAEVRHEENDGEDTSRRNYLHPFKILLAWATYKIGRGDKGKLHWIPNQKIVEALDEAFYRAFKAVVPTGKRFYLAVDVSGSMTSPVLGSRNMTCDMAAAAMMMVTARTEENSLIKAFSNKMQELSIQRNDKLDVVMQQMKKVSMGGTDCALPMIDAQESKIKNIDVFVVYTDNETWHGKVHPREALVQYRNYAGNQNVKLIVCGMASNKFTIADPTDLNMLDICGFDSHAPAVISEFAEGKI